MNRSESIAELAKALCKCQAEITNPTKDTKAYNYKYATLDGVWDVVRKPLTDNGLSVLQLPCNSEGQIGVSTMLMHESGEFVESYFGMVPAKINDPQGAGSLVTYLRRYSLMAALGVAPEDDDGEKAMPSQNSGHVKTLSSGAEFQFKGGKFKGKTFSQIPKEELQSYVNWMRDQGELSGQAADMVARAERFLNG